MQFSGVIAKEISPCHHRDTRCRAANRIQTAIDLPAGDQVGPDASSGQRAQASQSVSQRGASHRWAAEGVRRYMDISEWTRPLCPRPQKRTPLKHWDTLSRRSQHTDTRDNSAAFHLALDLIPGRVPW